MNLEISPEVIEDTTPNCDCHNCGTSIEEAAAIPNNDGDMHCEDCYYEEYGHCDSCDDEVGRDYLHCTPGDDVYCEDCHQEAVGNCSHCGEDSWADDMVYNDQRDEYECEDCGYAPSDQTPAWDVYSNDMIKSNTDFVNPKKDGYTKDTFSLIKSMRYQGIEIESNFNEEISRDDLMYSVNSSIAAMRDNPKDDRDGNYFGACNIVYDGSVTGGDDRYGYEVVANPRRGDVLFQDMLSMTKAVKQSGGYISSKCGYHLHIDTRDYDWQHFLVLLIMTKAIEPHIYSWLPNSRRTSNWCRPVSQRISDLKWITDRESFIDYYYDDSSYSSDKYNDKRYHGLNLHSHFQANQGVEIRYHSGTLNADKMLHWSILWSQVIDKCYVLGDKLADEMRDEHITDLYETSLFKSLKMMNLLEIDIVKINSLKDEYMVEAFDVEAQSNSSNLDEYKKDSLYLSSLLGLDQSKTYAVQPMLKFLTNSKYNEPTMTIDSLFSTFEIPVLTQEFYKDRMVEIMDNPHTSPDHLKSCFDKSDMFVDFDEDTMQFGVAKIMNGIFPTIDSDLIRDCATGYNLRYCREQLIPSDYDGIILSRA